MKPEDQIKTIINAISDSQRIRNGRPRQLISVDYQPETMTFLLHEGLVAAYRSSDQLLIKYIKAPMIIGMNTFVNTNADIFLKAYNNIRYEIIPSQYVLEIIDKNNLWKEVSYVYMYVIKQLLHAHKASAGLSTYELIRLNLLAFMEEDEDLRLNINVSDYIQEKTRISRSRIMTILGDLRTGGFIEIKRGILTHIHKLPDDY
ncbi:helix-turn-helix domain-containing protein [Citrobacter sedlakii]|uniref:helix-turn-helix domain-containing protein n=1 Tax=Citrobacter sedlakii TaxID=67826 RepID=UPI001BAD0D6D|nr:helix-turn-helix domain-containing protein [Citrobacter sedlakii]EKJ8216896.1 helix-turn-helix domain-containing protein [Citrobacter sedlakii]QUC28954.1 helix-turn-helix domain-containing protein [Citrobacter sedlakii]HCT5820300.1 helix-turn-helix domain-containing protein [Citrobacter sedlakii]